jgi:hypothetical protein
MPAAGGQKITVARAEIAEYLDAPLEGKCIVNRAEQSNLGRRLQSLRKTRAGGRPRTDQPRCPCGAMTAKRAKARGHRCEAKAEGN